MAAAWYSDKYNRRGVPLLIISILSIIGWATFLCASFAASGIRIQVK